MSQAVQMQREASSRVLRKTVSIEPSHEEIQARAYQLYLERGSNECRALDDWLQAEAELRAQALS